MRILFEKVEQVNLEMACYNSTKGGLMVSALIFALNHLGSIPGQRHCAVFLGITLSCESECLSPPRCINGYRQP